MRPGRQRRWRQAHRSGRCAKPAELPNGATDLAKLAKRPADLTELAKLSPNLAELAKLTANLTDLAANLTDLPDLAASLEVEVLHAARLADWNDQVAHGVDAQNLFTHHAVDGGHFDVVAPNQVGGVVGGDLRQGQPQRRRRGQRFGIGREFHRRIVDIRGVAVFLFKRVGVDQDRQLLVLGPE